MSEEEKELLHGGCADGPPGSSMRGHFTACVYEERLRGGRGGGGRGMGRRRWTGRRRRTGRGRRKRRTGKRWRTGRRWRRRRAAMDQDRERQGQVHPLFTSFPTKVFINWRIVTN